jgi:sorbitol/mannitol transport system permease protein
MIEMIFLMSVFAEIFTTTGGGPGRRQHQRGLPHLQAGTAELRRRRGLAGALFAVLLANIAAVFLIRLIGKNLD